MLCKKRLVKVSEGHQGCSPAYRSSPSQNDETILFCSGGGYNNLRITLMTHEFYEVFSKMRVHPMVPGSPGPVVTHAGLAHWQGSSPPLCNTTN